MRTVLLKLLSLAFSGYARRILQRTDSQFEEVSGSHREPKDFVPGFWTLLGGRSPLRHRAGTASATSLHRQPTQSRAGGKRTSLSSSFRKRRTALDDVRMAEKFGQNPDATEYYSTLGVSRTATKPEITSAFRKKARLCHPDINKSPEAEKQYRQVGRAYEVLKDGERRKAYDQYGEEGVSMYDQGASPGGAGAGGFQQDIDLGDLFDSFFGGGGGGFSSGGGFGGFGGGGFRQRSGPQEGDDLRFDLEIDLKVALFGGSQKIRLNQAKSCKTCGGTGVAPGAKVSTCDQCGGRGVVVQTVDTLIGRIQQQARCPKCNGAGTVVEKYCGTCSGSGLKSESNVLTINIPPGVEDGNKLRVRGEGEDGPKGGPPGDLYVFLKVKRDPRFRREGTEIYSDVSISYIDAILGTTVRVPIVDGGEIDLNVPRGTQPGTVLSLAGKGAPKLNRVKDRGTHYVTVNVEIPRKLSREEEELVKQLKARETT